MKTVAMTAVALAMLGGIALAQEDTSSGNFYYKGCKGVALEKYTDPIMNGLCLGAVAALMSMAKKNETCLPADVSRFQAVRVVVKFMDDHPTITNQDFMSIAGYSMQAAWPCKN